MDNQIFLSRFTPSLMTPEVLERIFVQRGDLAQHLVQIIRDSVLTPSKHHTLILGPRGIGKTHLLSLVHNRIVSQQDLEERMRVAWLWEEEWGVASFLDLLHRILRTLVETYDDPDLRAGAEELFSLTPKAAERRAGDLLRSFLNGRTLVLMAENLDDMFSGLGIKGQQRLRAYLQEEESWTLVSTAQGLFSGVSLHNSPFYGFFEIHHLNELSVDDAVRLIGNIAQLSGQEDLAKFVQSPAGRTRIRAVHHLAGGNHRVYVILSEFLTRESLDELVEPFLKMIDGLTPYYQSRMAQLSPQQRKIVDFLANTRGAIPVGQIAKRCFITSQTASSQLKDLREKGYVRSTPVGRDSYYELAEPLMRIALEVKKQREEPIRLFLDFLRYWYPRQELETLLTRIPAGDSHEHEYLRRVIDELSVQDAHQTHLDVEYTDRVEGEDWKGALRIAQELVERRGNALDWNGLGYCLVKLKCWNEAEDAFAHCLKIDSSIETALFGRISALLHLNHAGKALEIIDRYLDGNVGDATVYFSRGIAMELLGRNEEALNCFEETLRLDNGDLFAQAERARIFLRDGRLGEATSTIESLTTHVSAPPHAWGIRGQVMMAQQRYDEAVYSFDRELKGDPRNRQALMGKGTALFQLGRIVEANHVFEQVVEFYPSDGVAWSSLGLSAFALDEHDIALKAFRTACQYDRSGLSHGLLADELNQMGRSAEAEVVLDEAERNGIAQDMSRFARTRTLFNLGRFDDAVRLLDQAISLSDAEMRVGGIVSLIADLMRLSPNDSARAQRARAIYDVCRRHNLGSLLGSEITASTEALTRHSSNSEAVRVWVDLWREIAGQDKDFDITLHLIEALLEYHRTSDLRVLLALQSEERAVLEDLFKRTEKYLEQRKLFADSRQAERAPATSTTKPKESRKSSSRRGTRSG